MIEYIIACPDKETADAAYKSFKELGFVVERLSETTIKAIIKTPVKGANNA